MTKLAIFPAAASRVSSPPSPSLRRSPPFVCVWTRDPASGRLICCRRRADAEQAQSDRHRMIFRRGRPPSLWPAAA